MDQHSNKKSKSIKKILYILLISAMALWSNIYSDEDPKNPEPPEPTPCCPDNTTKEPEHTDVNTDPKTDESVELHYGEMGDVDIGLGGVSVKDKNVYFGYECTGIPGDTEFSAGGGGDSDVCVSTVTGRAVSTYGVDNEYIWSGDAPGTPFGPKNQFYHFTPPPKPEEGEILEYGLTVESEDKGPCNVDDANKNASTNIFCFFKYMVGDDPDGRMGPKPTGAFNTTPMYRYDDQLVQCYGDDMLYLIGHDVCDYDDYESGSDPLAWDDGPVNDTPGPYDVRWVTSTGQEKVGHLVHFLIPTAPVSGPITWVIQMFVNDDANTSPWPCMADDPEKLVDTGTWRVYHDHLGRDMANVGRLNQLRPPPEQYSVQIQPDHMCFGAANHAYRGITDPILVPQGIGTLVFRRTPDPVTGKYLVGSSVITLNDVPNLTPGRGSWFLYNGYGYGSGAGHINTSYSGTSVWEYNGRNNAILIEGILRPRWGTSTVQDYINEHHIESGDDIYGIHEIYYYPKQ